MKHRPTIKDVAARAGVSRQTVSRVINDKAEVNPETRERVLLAIQELDYRPSAIARSMVAGRTCTLGCIVPNLTDYTFASMIEGAQAEARRQGYFVLTASALTDGDAEAALQEMLLRQVDGLLAINPYADERHRFFQPLIEKGMAVVYLGNAPRGEPISSVRCDDELGGYEATCYLIDLGHERIATLTGPLNEECSLDRLEGYQRALDEAGLDTQNRLIGTGDWSTESGYRAIRQMLETGPEFTAVFVQNDRMAAGVIRCLRDVGLRVPQDVSVIGYDDIPLAAYLEPPLTTLRQPFDLLGQRSVQLLIRALATPPQNPKQVFFKARLIERASCVRLKGP